MLNRPEKQASGLFDLQIGRNNPHAEDLVMDEQTAEERVRELSWVRGYAQAIRDYGIWSNGTQHIGCLETPIKEVIKNLAEKHGFSVEDL